MSAPAKEELLESGRSAADRRAWPESYEALTAANAAGELDPGDLETLAKSAWWVGRQNEAIEVFERAYASHIERGDGARAAFMALTLRRMNVAKLAASVAQGWLTRAERLLADEPESLVHGYLELARAAGPWGRGQLEEALVFIRRAIEIAHRFDDTDLHAWATSYAGMVLLEMGRVDEGWPLMEEVSAAAVGGELGAYTTGAAFCNVIAALFVESPDGDPVRESGAGRDVLNHARTLAPATDTPNHAGSSECLGGGRYRNRYRAAGFRPPALSLWTSRSSGVSTP